jgi:hypothetical protein
LSVTPIAVLARCSFDERPLRSGTPAEQCLLLIFRTLPEDRLLDLVATLEAPGRSQMQLSALSRALEERALKIRGVEFSAVSDELGLELVDALKHEHETFFEEVLEIVLRDQTYLQRLATSKATRG